MTPTLKNPKESLDYTSIVDCDIYPLFHHRRAIDSYLHPKTLLKLEQSWKIHGQTLLIQTEQDYEQALRLAEQLTFLPVSSPQLTVLYRCLVELIEAYEAKAFPMASPLSHDILKHLLESSQTSPQQLADLLESPQSVQAILKGQQKLTPNEADRVGQYFQLDPSLFLAK